MAGSEALDAHHHETTGSWRGRGGTPLPPILAAALEELQEHGFHGTTVRRIASGVGLTMPSLYYYYGSKEGILSALLNIAMDDLLARIRDALADAGQDTRGRFINVMTAVGLHNTRQRDLARLHDESRVLGPELRAGYVAKRAVVDDTLVEVLDAGVADGTFSSSDTRFDARLLLGMLSGIIDWYNDDGGYTAEEIAKAYAQTALRVVILPKPIV